MNDTLLYLQISGNIRDLNQARDLYYHVFRWISCQLDLELAVPGTYIPGQELICIISIQSNMQVITSKQRSRKLCSTGKEYKFLLKSHEDFCQVERVM